MDKDPRKKLLLPYLPEVVRLADQIRTTAEKLELDVAEYYRDDIPYPDPIPTTCGYEELYAQCTAILLTARAAISAAGLGTKPLP